MSDISIPGISNNNGINTSRMVEDLMEVERIPVRRMETQVETFEGQREAWQSMGRALARLRDTSRTLYGFENPFRERIAASSDESILGAVATRQAEEGIEELTVLQTAGRDRFASSSVDREFRVPSGYYEFTVGDETRSFRFGGGDLRRFAEEMNSRLDELVRATVVPDTANTHVLVVEGRQEGASARLGFGGDAVGLLEEIGMLASARPDESVALLQDEPLRLEPGGRRELPLERPFAIRPGMVLRFEARTEEVVREPWTEQTIPTGPDLPEPGSITFGDVTITDDRLGLDLPEPEIPEPPPVVEDNRAMSIIGGGVNQSLPAIPESSAFQGVEIAAADLVSSTTGFTFHNRNTDRAIEIRNIEILDPTQRGDSAPRNALDTARDARILYSGIEIQRSSNEIDDLIPGVTLNLRRASDDPVEIDVQPDREFAKDSIIEFIGFYNQVVRDINIYTRTDQDLVDQIEYFDDSERETMEERLGIFQGDSSLNQLRTRMQTIMMNPYDTGNDSAIRLLAQIGISTNASGTGGGFDASRLRGYLEINESVLDDALANDFEATGRLFGRDTDGDLVMDTGVAVALEQFVAPYVRTGGIVANRTDSLNTRIDQTQDRITQYNERLEDYEQQLRVDFGRMEGLMQQLQENSQALDRLGGPSDQ
ncbi:MAG: flagellar filament capping protein FliD [Spirochaetales bacterium]|nr:flagellar filament capping protein FliD [Spirochaetales bacterium]